VADDQLVAHGGGDDPGHHRQVEVGIGGPPDAARISGRDDLLAAGPGRAVEIDPPQRDAAEEGHYQRGYDGRPVGEPGAAGRDADVDDGLAERDHDEELAALGEVTALDGPVAGPRPAEAGHREAGGRPAGVGRDGSEP
jgi:hypothetical protein